MKLNEEKIAKIAFEQIDKSGILNYIKKDKDFEKRVKEICLDVASDVFKSIWQHNNMFRNIVK